MARIAGPTGSRRGGFPHARGDGPTQWFRPISPARISPRAWGWPVGREQRAGRFDDFPTRVGMARADRRASRQRTGFPHARGDGPDFPGNDLADVGISPRAWGWPEPEEIISLPSIDFPTRVGMARTRRKRPTQSARFPHARGDGPLGAGDMDAGEAISPRAWGWPVIQHPASLVPADFPTRVGMARRLATGSSWPIRFPHARGDGPHPAFLHGCMRGISPRAWGWPAMSHGYGTLDLDFPTRVGMARVRRLRSRLWPRFPHARGDGPSPACGRGVDF